MVKVSAGVGGEPALENHNIFKISFIWLEMLFPKR